METLPEGKNIRKYYRNFFDFSGSGTTKEEAMKKIKDRLAFIYDNEDIDLNLLN